MSKLLASQKPQLIQNICFHIELNAENPHTFGYSTSFRRLKILSVLVLNFHHAFVNMVSYRKKCLHRFPCCCIHPAGSRSHSWLSWGYGISQQAQGMKPRAFLTLLTRFCLNLGRTISGPGRILHMSFNLVGSLLHTTWAQVLRGLFRVLAVTYKTP
jgi:hypothetical protein